MPLVAVTIDSEQVITWILGSAALVTAVAVLGRLLWRYVIRPVRAVIRVVDQELTNNHGSSMKDDVHGIAVTVGLLSRQMKDLEPLPGQVSNLSRDLYNHLAEKGPKSP